MPINAALQALINADPIYAQTLVNTQAASSAERAQRNQSLQRAMEEFGQIPDLTGSAQQLGLNTSDLSQINTPEAQALALAGTRAGTSTLAQLNQSQKDAIQGITNALASRGMLRSGDTGYSMGKQNLASTQAQYNARKALLDYLGGVQSGFAAAERQRQSDLSGALSDAYGRILAQYPNGLPGQGQGTGTPAANPPSTTPVTAPAVVYPTPPKGAIVGAPGGAQDPTHGGPIAVAPPVVTTPSLGPIAGTVGGAQDPSHGGSTRPPGLQPPPIVAPNLPVWGAPQVTPTTKPAPKPVTAPPKTVAPPWGFLSPVATPWYNPYGVTAGANTYR